MNKKKLALVQMIVKATLKLVVVRRASSINSFLVLTS